MKTEDTLKKLIMSFVGRGNDRGKKQLDHIELLHQQQQQEVLSF